ncbi:unnamed protein product [Cylindrotheca closterium]|uniref:Phosphoglycerate mutase (2,3-diphosphoglycerate-dependent) n=1 Tax=Cylindrotheca closterium TaxID=2856 RepID=A0AAD2GD97_9STRA|nr:unnamed protein product [Cylindrotheca closterium]
MKVAIYNLIASFAFLSLGNSFRLHTTVPPPLRVSSSLSESNYGNDAVDSCRTKDGISRRGAIAACAIPLVFLPLTSLAAETPPENYECLLDLPPLPEDQVRIYLCRHGQTENNRLRKVQGARVDPPINTNGIIQAQNAGKALSKASPCPQTFFCSDLQRARLTAEQASSQINPQIVPKPLSLLREVDFGPVAEGQPVATAKAGMEATYAAWAIGNVDYRPTGGGESGREVLNRAVESMEYLVKQAEDSPNRCVGAVSHSTFIRILVGILLDEPLVKTATRKIDNCSITVLDFPKGFKTQRLGPKDKLLGGLLSRAPPDFTLDVPICTVVRTNENRHLPEIPLGELLPSRARDG